METLSWRPGCALLGGGVLAPPRARLLRSPACPVGAGSWSGCSCAVARVAVRRADAIAGRLKAAGSAFSVRKVRSGPSGLSCERGMSRAPWNQGPVLLGARRGRSSDSAVSHRRSVPSRLLRRQDREDEPRAGGDSSGDLRFRGSDLERGIAPGDDGEVPVAGRSARARRCSIPTLLGAPCELGDRSWGC